jgi:protein-disulfide isomerase
MKRRSTSTVEPAELAAPVTKHDHTRGDPKAPVTLLEYGDYECSYCGAAHRLVKMLQEAMETDLCYVFRNFPLTDVHRHAEHAAEAVEAAGVQGHFWEMHDAVFENQDALDDDDLASYAADVGLDANRVIAEVEESKYRPRIERDVQSGMRSGVEGTPSFFINGVKYDGPTDPEAMLTALQEAREGR